MSLKSGEQQFRKLKETYFFREMREQTGILFALDGGVRVMLLHGRKMPTDRWASAEMK